MSNNSKSPNVDELHFRLAVNLHYGAFNLLNDSIEQLSQLNLISKSELERFRKFVQFYQNLLVRGAKKIYPESTKPSDYDSSRSAS